MFRQAEEGIISYFKVKHTERCFLPERSESAVEGLFYNNFALRLRVSLAVGSPFSEENSYFMNSS